MEVEAVLGDTKQTVGTFGEDAKVSTEDAGGVGTEKDVVAKEPSGGEQQPAAEGEGEGTEKEAPKEDSGEEDLGDYDPASEETVAKFDGRYLKEGLLDREALTTEFWGNEGKLKDSTRAYLQDRMGISGQMIDEVSAALKAQQDGAVGQLRERVHGLAGGEEAYAAALKWGNEGGYTPEQRARFDTLAKQGGEAFDDAVLALMARARAANAIPEAKPPTPNFRPRRQASPARNATAGARSGQQVADGGAPAAQPYATMDAYRADLKAAGNDPRKNAEVRARLRASPFARTAGQ